MIKTINYSTKDNFKFIDKDEMTQKIKMDKNILILKIKNHNLFTTLTLR